MRKDARIRVQPCSITLRTLRPPRIRASDVGTLRVSISYISIPAPAPSGLAENKNKKIYLQFAIVYRWTREVGGSGQWLAGPINTPPFFAVTSPSFSTLYPSSSPPSSSPSPCPRRSPPLPVHVDVPQRALAQLTPLSPTLSPFASYRRTPGAATHLNNVRTRRREGGRPCPRQQQWYRVRASEGEEEEGVQGFRP